MSTLDDLIAARALIARPGDWGTVWRSRRGSSPYCALGAIAKAIFGDAESYRVYCDGDAVLAPLAAALPAEARNTSRFTSTQIGLFNDRSTHAEVLALFDRAIERQRLIEQMGEQPACKNLNSFLPPVLIPADG